MFAGRTTAEIVAGNDDFGIAISRFIQYEIRVLGTILAITSLGEQALSKTSALDRLEIVLRNDHVGVDIDNRKGGGNARQLFEFFHDRPPRRLYSAAIKYFQENLKSDSVPIGTPFGGAP
ncbi:hypothetical protein D3C73_1066650 [compost metagenome]